MIKIRVKILDGYWEKHSGHSYMVNDYLYCVYFLGFLIHSLKVVGVSPNIAIMMFGEDKIEWAKENK